MKIGIPCETLPQETRVAATPKTVAQLIKLGYSVVIEKGAGKHANYDDSAYEEAGAQLVKGKEAWGADVVLRVNAPSAKEVSNLNEGATLISLLSPATNEDLLKQLNKRRINALAMDAVPRISRAQSLDVLSSMANVAGYRAVIEATHEFGSFLTGQITAAGKVPPAKVLVIGAGVAGLAAIGTAKSLGAIVRATDARAAVKEQVESMGAEFLTIEAEAQKSTDGYAKETSEAFNEAAARLYAEQCKDVDIVITTALIPGKPAPRLLTKEMVASMKPGSIIVDMATSNGGNVEGSAKDQLVTTPNGAKIIGYTDLAGRLPAQSSQLYSTNLVNLLKLMTPAKDGELTFDLDDVVIRAISTTYDGEILWPPPPIAVSAASAPDTTQNTIVEEASKKQSSARLWVFGTLLVLFGLMAWFSPASFFSHFMVFMLACVIGYYVIGNVHHALHTPLMSVTNAISGIIVIGAIPQIASDNTVIVALALIATFVASINVFGGFTVTHRMLAMFKKD